MFGTSWIFRILSTCERTYGRYRSITDEIKLAQRTTKLGSPTTYWNMAKL